MIHSDASNSLDHYRAVLLLAFGISGLHFIERVSAGTSKRPKKTRSRIPLADAGYRRHRCVAELDLSYVSFLFLALGIDATDIDVEEAIQATQLAKSQGVITVAVTIGSAGRRDLDSDSSTSWSLPWLSTSPSSSQVPKLGRLLRRVDGQIAVRESQMLHDTDAFGWFYGTLRSLSKKGLLLLEPAWDLHDVTEVLDLPGARLVLTTRTVEAGETASTALEDVLIDLQNGDVDLALASGVLAIVWQQPSNRLTVRDISTIGRTVRAAIGAGGQHMVLSAQSKHAEAQLGTVGASVTLVVSLPGWDC